MGDIDHILRMKLLKLYETDGIEETKENLAYLKIANAIAEYLRSSIGSDWERQSRKCEQYLVKLARDEAVTEWESISRNQMGSTAPPQSRW